MGAHRGRESILYIEGVMLPCSGVSYLFQTLHVFEVEPDVEKAKIRIYKLKLQEKERAGERETEGERERDRGRERQRQRQRAGARQRGGERESRRETERETEGERGTERQRMWSVLLVSEKTNVRAYYSSISIVAVEYVISEHSQEPF